MEIATGTSEQHPTPLPYDPAQSPANAGLSATAGQLSGPTVAAADTVGQQASRLSGYEADATAAMHAGMQAETDRRAGHQADMLPMGASYGVPVPVEQYPNPAFEVPPTDFDYPSSGDEPPIGG